MENRNFRFVTLKDLGKEAILMAINEEYVQTFTRDNFERELSDIELNRFAKGGWENNGAFGALMDLTHNLIEEICDTERNDWLEIDSKFLIGLSQEEKLECIKEHQETADKHYSINV